MTGYLLSISFFQECLQWLEQWDTYLFLKINTVWTNPVLDSIYPWWRDANAWIPLYLFLLVFVLLNFKKKALPWILFAVLTLVLTDQLNSTYIKSWVGRLRPCSDPNFMGHVRLLLNNCSGGFSFPSSHAVNHFGFAMFVFLTLRPIFKKWGYLLFLWAGSIVYGQVYVGVHYPVDVVCGSLLGCLLGYIMATIFNKKIGVLNTDTL
jgi:undecaprenyl-diphosphatase